MKQTFDALHKFVCLLTVGILIQLSLSELALGADPIVLVPKAEIEKLPLITEADFRKWQDIEPEIFAGLPRHQVHVFDLPIIRRIYERVSDEGMGWVPLRFFADEMFRYEGIAVYISNETLTQLDLLYDSRSLFPIRGKTVGSDDMQEGSPFTMQAMVFGNGGKIWVMYSNSVRFRSQEYDVLTARFDLYRSNCLRVGVDKVGRFALLSILGRNDRQESFRPIRGPLNVEVKRIVLHPNQKGAFLESKLFGAIDLPQRPISRRRP